MTLSKMSSCQLEIGVEASLAGAVKGQQLSTSSARYEDANEVRWNRDPGGHMVPCDGGNDA